MTNFGNICQRPHHFGFTRSNLKAKVKQHLGQGIACLRDCLRTPDAAVKGSDVNAAYRWVDNTKSGLSKSRWYLSQVDNLNDMTIYNLE